MSLGGSIWRESGPGLVSVVRSALLRSRERDGPVWCRPCESRIGVARPTFRTTLGLRSAAWRTRAGRRLRIAESEMRLGERADSEGGKWGDRMGLQRLNLKSSSCAGAILFVCSRPRTRAESKFRPTPKSTSSLALFARQVLSGEDGEQDDDDFCTRIRTNDARSARSWCEPPHRAQVRFLWRREATRLADVPRSQALPEALRTRSQYPHHRPRVQCRRRLLCQSLSLSTEDG